jgi:fucokinase
LVLQQWGSDGHVIENIEISELSQMLDYSQPHAPGALLKAAFICAGIVETVSNVPQGSGLGTSSILGGAIMGALWKAAGQNHSKDSLIHAVLYLEQLLTTGGGWQDQCGGLYGGAKISRSDTGLPVKITTQQIATPAGFMGTLSDHLMLVYTGRTRLARNLLQDVLRNWHSREAKIVSTMTELVANAMKAVDAFKEGNLEILGECLNRYREQKLIMTPGCIPKSVKFFIEKAESYIHGCSLTGAGGGGFLAAILRSPSDRHKVEEIVRSSPELRDFKLFSASVDDHGLAYL